MAIFLAVGVALTVAFLISRSGLSQDDLNVRTRSFVWPAVEVVVGVSVVGALAWRAKRNTSNDRQSMPSSSTIASDADVTVVGNVAAKRVRGGWWAAAILLICETIFLVAAGAPIWSSSTTFFATTPAVASLQQAVGSSTVAFGRGNFGDLGILPEANDAYGIHEIDIYDPIVPAKYFRGRGRRLW